MKDRVPLYPGRVKLTPVSGQENTYDMVRADEPTQEGTPLSKATFLKDATAALFGLGSDAVPDDALAVLSRLHNGLGNEYVWSKSDSSGVVGYVNSPDPNAYPPAVSDGYTYMALGQLGKKVQIATGSYVGTGTSDKSNPNSLTFEFAPKIIMIIRNNTAPTGYPFWGFLFPHFTNDYGISGASYFQDGAYLRLYNIRAWAQDGGTTVKWYSTNPDRQLNSSGTEFTYSAIG